MSRGGARYVGSVLDSRLYRAAFLPALIAVFVCAFSLTDRPAPATTPLAADAFDTSRAFGAPRQPPRNSLRELAAAFPDRRPGSTGDDGAGERVERAMRRAAVPHRAQRRQRAHGRRAARPRHGDRRAARACRAAGSSCWPTATRSPCPGWRSSRAPRRCSSSRASSRCASCARRSCWSRPRAAPAAAPARAHGRSATRARRSTP